MLFIYLPEKAIAISKKESYLEAEIAQLGERQTEDLKVAGSIPALGVLFGQEVVLFFADLRP